MYTLSHDPSPDTQPSFEVTIETNSIVRRHLTRAFERGAIRAHWATDCLNLSKLTLLFTGRLVFVVLIKPRVVHHNLLWYGYAMKAHTRLATYSHDWQNWSSTCVLLASSLVQFHTYSRRCSGTTPRTSPKLDSLRRHTPCPDASYSSSTASTVHACPQKCLI